MDYGKLPVEPQLVVDDLPSGDKYVINGSAMAWQGDHPTQGDTSLPPHVKKTTTVAVKMLVGKSWWMISQVVTNMSPLALYIGNSHKWWYGTIKKGG